MDIEQRLQPPTTCPPLDYPDHQEQVIQRFTIFLTDEDENDLKIEESEEEDKILTKRKKTGKRKGDLVSKKNSEKPKLKKKRRRKRKADVNDNKETSTSSNVSIPTNTSTNPTENVEPEEAPVAQKKKKSPYPCHHCYYISSWKTNLEKHMMAQHTGERPYKCPHCEYGSVHQSQMEKHWNTHHLGAVIHCSVCAFSAQAVEVYCKHLSQAHSDQRSLSCGVCGRRAVSLTALEMHILDKHKPTCPTFTCTLCGYNSAVEENLQSHLRNLHRCTDCGFNSSSPREVRRHKKKAHRARPSKAGSQCPLPQSDGPHSPEEKANSPEEDTIPQEETLHNDSDEASAST